MSSIPQSQNYDDIIHPKTANVRYQKSWQCSVQKNENKVPEKIKFSNW